MASETSSPAKRHERCRQPLNSLEGQMYRIVPVPTLETYTLQFCAPGELVVSLATPIANRNCTACLTVCRLYSISSLTWAGPGAKKLHSVLCGEVTVDFVSPSSLPRVQNCRFYVSKVRTGTILYVWPSRELRGCLQRSCRFAGLPGLGKN